MDIKKICKCQKKHQKNLLSKSNVTSVGYGYKIKNGQITEEVCLVVGVSKKVVASQLKASDLIPSDIDGVSTDVIEVGHITIHKKKNKVKTKTKTKTLSTTQSFDPKQKMRPALSGISVGHPMVTAGTFGCVVRKNGMKYILSNNHVISNANNASIGDPIYQPGQHDGGTSNDRIGELSDFVRILFPGDNSNDDKEETGGNSTCKFASLVASVANAFAQVLGRNHRLVAMNTQIPDNEVDAAIAKPDQEQDILEEIVQIGKPSGITEAVLGMDVQKYGRTTRYTQGKVLQLNATVQVDYGEGRIGQFTGQIITNNMSAGGDSGSVVLDMSNRLIGLLFAGSNAVTILNPIQKVFEKLKVSL